MDIEEQIIKPDEQPANSGIDHAQFKALIDVHFQTIRTLLQYNREKDANISKLNATVQKYRDGFDSTMLKALSLHVISFREDCQKARRELKELSADTAKKYLGYIVMDYESLLGNLNVECVDGEWHYNNKKINSDIAKNIAFPEPEEVEIPDAATADIASLNDFADYLKGVETTIVAVLKNNAERDRLLNAYIEHSSLYEQAIQQAILYPVIRKIISVYERVQSDVKQKTDGITQENCNESYASALELVVEETEKILALCSVTIDGCTSDAYDPKKQRILKTIATDDENKNGVVVNRYTDCYLTDEKVIYPQKVDVYKK